MAKSGSKKNVEQKKTEALSILQALGLPPQQLNERSALTLLSLLALGPDDLWSEASAPLMGITPMMDFFSEHYGKRYAPNSRETVRRQTVHQFLQAGMIVANPDDPSRPTNSGKTVYQVETSLLRLVTHFGKKEWKQNLKKYHAGVVTLKRLYAKQRTMRRIPVTLSNGERLELSPGGQNVLVREVIEKFCPLYTPGGEVLYIGDTQKKLAYFDQDKLEALGVKVSEHGKMPDIVVHYVSKGWLVLIEAVTTHGPVDPKRHVELKRLFAGSKAGLVFVTAFLDMKTMVRYLRHISWETEVWIAESPTHLVHFNGERFLGPYDD